VTASSDGTAKIWDASTGILLHDLIGHEANFNVKWAEFSPDGSLVITASEDKTAKIWDAKNGGAALKTLAGELPQMVEFSGRMACFSKDGVLAVTALKNNTAKIWRLVPAEILHTPKLAKKIYIDLIKKYMNSLVDKTTASYKGFIEFITQEKYQEKYLGQAIEADALIFSTLEKSSQEYLRVLLPGRP
jgi:WD40 repeat protein